MAHKNNQDVYVVSEMDLQAELAKRERLKRQRLYSRCDTLWFFMKEMDSVFFKNNRPHLMLKAILLQLLDEGLFKGLCISEPRRYGKSYTITMGTAWTLGKNPDRTNMRNSYAAKLAEKFSRDVRAIIRKKKYKSIFPNLELSKEKKAATEWYVSNDGETYSLPAHLCGGVDGSTTGFGCNNWLIADDLIKNFEQSMSDTYMGHLSDWKDSCHDSSEEIGCKRIECATRWSINDPIGKVLKEEPHYTVDIYKYFPKLYGANDDEFLSILEEIKLEIKGKIRSDGWVELRIPALDKYDISTCEDLRPTIDLVKKRDQLIKSGKESIWYSIYQQEPIEKHGMTIQKKDLMRFSMYDLVPEYMIKIATVDVAFGGGDALCMPVVALSKDFFYVIDVIFSYEDRTITKAKIVNMIEKHNLKEAIFEANNGGEDYMLDIDRMLMSKHSDTIVYCRREKENKVVRIEMYSYDIINKMLFLNDEEIEPGSDYDMYMKSLCSHKRGVKNQEDNAIDATCNIVRWFALGNDEDDVEIF